MYPQVNLHISRTTIPYPIILIRGPKLFETVVQKNSQHINYIKSDLGITDTFATVCHIQINLTALYIKHCGTLKCTVINLFIIPVYVFTDSYVRQNQVLITSNTTMHKHSDEDVFMVDFIYSVRNPKGEIKDCQKSS